MAAANFGLLLFIFIRILNGILPVILKFFRDVIMHGLVHLAAVTVRMRFSYNTVFCWTLGVIPPFFVFFRVTSMMCRLLKPRLLRELVRPFAAFAGSHVSFHFTIVPPFFFLLVEVHRCLTRDFLWAVRRGLGRPSINSWFLEIFPSRRNQAFQG